MQIDWITVAAQIVNFLILVWLLHHFLYGPVTRAMERREKRIEDRLADAELAKEAAAAQKRTYEDRQDELERQKRSILSKARKAADETRKEMLREARDETDAKHREWREQIESQQQEFLRELRQRVAEEFFELVRKTLRDVADADLEARMASVFVRHLEELDDDEREKLTTAAEDAGQVTVETCLELGEDDRRTLADGLNEALETGVEMEYRHEPSRAFGIELSAGSQTVVWTFDDYLGRLERSLRDMLAERMPEEKNVASHGSEAS